ACLTCAAALSITCTTLFVLASIARAQNAASDDDASRSSFLVPVQPVDPLLRARVDALAAKRASTEEALSPADLAIQIAPHAPANTNAPSRMDSGDPNPGRLNTVIDSVRVP